MLIADLARKMKMTKQGLYHRIKLARIAFPTETWKILHKNVDGKSRAYLPKKTAARLLKYHRYSHREKKAA